MHKPDFSLLRGPIMGYKPESGPPTKENVRRLRDECFACLDDEDMDGMFTWDEVLFNVYQHLGFFRHYYCAKDVSEEIYRGGITSEELNQSEEEWQRWAAAEIRRKVRKKIEDDNRRTQK